MELFSFFRILKFLNLGNIKFIKKKFGYSNHEFFSFPRDKFFFLNNLILLYEKLFSKFAFRFNNIIFDSFSFPKKKFIKISLKNFLFPSLYKILFKDEGTKEDLNFDKRVSYFDQFTKKKYNDKFYEFLIKNLVYDLPVSYFENFLKSKKKCCF